MRPGVLLIIAASTAFAASCDDGSGLLIVRPKLALEPEAPAELQFGQVVLGKTRAEPIILDAKNIGDSVLSIDRISIEGESSSPFRVSSFPGQLPPSGSNEIWVRFEPTAQASYEGSLNIYSNDPDRRIATFSMKGSAIEPCTITAGPAHSVMLLGQIQTITVGAHGGIDCVISRLFTDQTMFAFVGVPELPFTIPAGTSFDLQLQHVAPSLAPGVPIREIIVQEREGQEVRMTVQGEPPVSGCLEFFPDAGERIYFDETPLGELAYNRAYATNTCTKEVFVTSALMIVGSYYFDTDERMFPLRVPPQETVAIPISYAPFSSDGDEGVLVFTSNDASVLRHEISLFGRAAVPVVRYFPAYVDFGTVIFKNPDMDMVSECSSSAFTVQVYNEGGYDLTISSFEFEGDTEFEVSGVLIEDPQSGSAVPVLDFTQPFQVRPGSDARISLRFSPVRSSPESHNGRLLIHHNAAGSPSEVELTGTAAPAGQATDTFMQLAGPKADILWVIDSSCSMFDEQARLIENMSQFVGYADSLDSDYQMAVIDTDGKSPLAGRFRECFPHPRILSHDYPDRQVAFECLFNVGTTGTGDEAGLAAAMNALDIATNPSRQFHDRNVGFVRDDAKLVIVLMSDEYDHSDESLPLLRDFYLSVKPNRPDLVSVHAIAGPVFEECENPGRFGPAEPAIEYFWMTEQLGGGFYNICLEDWQPLLRSLGIDTFTANDEFTLSQTADPGTLVVTVNGVLVLPDPTDGYTYNAAFNTVKFHGISLPPPGAQIVIDYEGLCRP